MHFFIIVISKQLHVYSTSTFWNLTDILFKMPGKCGSFTCLFRKGQLHFYYLAIWETNILSFHLPTLIHFLGSMLSSCAHSSKSLSVWLVCLFDTCCMKDFHLAKIKSWKPDFVEVEHQKMWFFKSSPIVQSLRNLLLCWQPEVS